MADGSNQTTEKTNAADGKKRSLFKKKVKKNKQARKRIKDDEDEDIDSTSDAIRLAQKKRKLLQSTLYKRGIDAAAMIKPGLEREEEAVNNQEDEPSSSVSDLANRLHGTFSGGTGADTSSSGERILQRKHQASMEEYIRSNLNANKKLERTGSNSNNEGGGGGSATQQPQPADLKARLYEELADTSKKMLSQGGANESRTMKSDAGNLGEEGDVGAGGAVLGGTGIAEVILPAQERLENAKATEAAAAVTSGARKRTADNRRHDKNNTTTAALIEDDEVLREVASASSAGFQVLKGDVSNVSSSFSQNFRMHAREHWLSRKRQLEGAETKNRTTSEAGDVNPSTSDEPSVDSDRLGFEAARKVARGESLENTSKVRNEQRASDDRVWRQFLAKGKMR